MIIPIGHDQSIRRLPWATIGIVAICTLVQAYAQFGAPHGIGSIDINAPDSSDRIFALLAKVPIWRFGYHTDTSGWDSTLITSAFVHAGWLHLIGNMIFLVLAGSVLEDRWGRAKYLLFYCAGAVASALAFKLTYGGPTTILVGASGAISAAMGAFLVYYAGTQITFWYWMYMRSGTFRMTAYFALPLWLLEQFLWAALDHNARGVSGTAYAAHIGGFAFGAVCALVANMIYGKRDHAGDELPIPKATATVSEPDRFTSCMDAIRRRDVDAVRAIASRTILDLSRAGDEVRILRIYDAMIANLETAPITDGAFAVTAAAAQGDHFESVAATFDREHPTSPQLPKVLWRLAQEQRNARRVDQAVATLEALATRFPSHPLGVQAAEALASRKA